MFARRREALHGTTALAGMARLQAAGVAPDGFLDWRVDGSMGKDDEQRVREFLRVQVRFSPWMICSRCLEPVQVQDLATDTLFRQAASESQAAREDQESEAIEVIAASTSLDLGALVEDEAILALPMAPAHDDCSLASIPGSLTGGDV